MRIVIDTQVFIHALFHDDCCRKIIKLEERGQVKIFISPEIDTEWKKAFIGHAVELGMDVTDVKYYFKYLYGCVAALEKVFPKKHVELAEDPDNNKFLDCAIEADALYIITTDIKSYNLRKPIVNNHQEQIKIVTPEDFLKEVFSEKFPVHGQ